MKNYMYTLLFLLCSFSFTHAQTADDKNKLQQLSLIF